MAPFSLFHSEGDLPARKSQKRGELYQKMNLSENFQPVSKLPSMILSTAWKFKLDWLHEMHFVLEYAHAESYTKSPYQTNGTSNMYPVRGCRKNLLF